MGLARLVGAVLLVSLCFRAQGQRPLQNRPESIAGVVMDPSGAVVPGATVMLLTAETPAKIVRWTETGPTGRYRIWATPGTYTVVVVAKGFARFESELTGIGVAPLGSDDTPARGRTLDVSLKVEPKIERIVVASDVERDTSSSGNSLVLDASDVAEMPLDSVALLDELKGLAGSPDATLYVDGFSRSKLPPRDSIRQVRINRNSYSAENDTEPASGVIQVLSKPGTDTTHGNAYLYGDDSALNAGNPLAPAPPYYAYGMGGMLSGPLNRRASYFAGWDQMRQEIQSAVDAQMLDASLHLVAARYAVANPRTTLNVSPRLDVRAGANSTMTFRYIVDRATQRNGGVGQLALASQGFDSTSNAQTLRVANTQLIGVKIVNETRFQYVRTRTAQTPVSSDPTIVVEGALMGGGNGLGAFSDHQDRVELQNYVSVAEGRHYLELGGRVRVGRDANWSQANFNGEYIFSTLSAYQGTMRGTPEASEFSLTMGNPNAAVTMADGALFAQDDWKVRPNLTLSYGLRFETQNYVSDHADWAPRVGFSWGLGNGGAKSAPKYVLRGGAGVFYRRFSSDSALEVERQSGMTRYVVEAPQFCPIAQGTTISLTSWCGVAPSSAAELAAEAASATVYHVSPSWHAPYSVGATVGLERQIGRAGTVGVAYVSNRGVHTQLMENVNAPMPGTYNPAHAGSGVRPNGGSQNVYEYVSEGVSRSNQLTINGAGRGARYTVYGSYVLRFDESDADGDGAFPANQFNLGADYGRALSDVRHTATAGGSVSLPYGVRSWGYLRATSGAPFNIVVGQDVNGDTQYNDRPAFATDLTRPSVVRTAWGSFDTDPIAGETIVPRNYGRGPGMFLVSMAVGKSVGVGPTVEPAPGTKGPLPRKYTVELWVEAQNVLNHPNRTAPVGTLNSPLFGTSVGLTGESSLSPDRLVDLQLSMQF